ncbi:uncharacterized protein EV422DRAFT_506822 [Fimicolochytrium jonesii]|uniref:uncharacterized protein n=1 Tax=Fimicolochytrium jonesii TaxID=1396493 RepID=UPI0022FEE15E|nr:uncharacterized protein EV422DRAFT_506822 [Fimicolochytrium jonesii]KAI8820080.1 hypothetical protein EV422DRAFT_506822 [Fimicolochytrium jonesii]
MSQAFKDVDACFGSSDSKQVALDAFLKLKETKALQTWTPTHFKLLLERMLVGPWVDEDRIAIIDDTRADLGIKANHEYRWRLAGVYADTDAAIVRAREEHQRGLDILRKAYEQNPSLALNRRVMRKELQGKRYKSVRWLLRLEETVKAALEEYPTSHCDRFLDLMFKAIARRRDVPLLEKWMSIVRHSSVRPGPAAYSAIIDAYGETGNLSQAENWYHNFLKTTLPKQETVFVAYANALVRGGKVKEARVFLEELIETTLEMKISRPTYTALIKIFILDNDAESAQIFVRKLENRNKPGVPPPDGNMYAAILECALENDYYAFSQRLVEKLMRYPFHWAHNSRLLSSYGELAIKNGDLDAALAVYHQLYGCNAIPHPDFTRALVQALTHADRRGDVFDMLGNLLTKLRRRRDLSQLKHRRDKNWTVLIRQIVQFDDTDFDLLLLAHEVILRSYTPHMFDLTGRALIAAYDRVREGRGPISRKLVAEDFLTIYHALFFSHMPSAEIAARVLVYLDDMNRAGLQPTNHIDELVRKGLARCSPSLPEEATKWRLSIAAGPPPRSGPAEEPKKIMVRTPEHTRPRAPLATLHSFDKQIGDLCERGHRTEAMILLRYIGSDGQMPSPHVYGQLVHLCTRERDFKSLDYLFGMYKQLFRQSDTADRGDLQMLTEYEGHLAKGTLLAHLESEKHGGQVITVLDIYKSMASMKALFGYNPYGVKDYEQLFEAIYDRAERKQVPALRGPQDVQALMSAYKEFRALTASSVPEDDVPRQTHLANTHLTLLHILIATDRTQAAITVFNDIVNIPNIESYIDTGMIYHAILTHLATTPSRTRQMLTHTAVALYYKYIGAHADAAPDPRLVNAMILVYGAAGNQDGLDRMFRLAAYRDVRIPPETCNTLLATLAKSTDLQYANLVKVRRKVEEMGYTLTAGTYEALIAYLTSVRRRDLAEAERVYAEMLQRGLAPTKRVLEDLVAAALESRPRGYTDTRPAPPPPTDALAKARVYRAACVAAHGTSTMKLDSAILTHLLGVLRDYDAAKEMYRRMEVRHRSPKVYAAVVRAAVDASRGVFVKMEQTSQGSGDDSTQADDTTPAASDGDSAATRMQTQTQAQIHHDPETELRFARTVLDEMKTAKRGTPAVNLIAQCEAMVVEREREVERAGRVVGDVGWA